MLDASKTSATRLRHNQYECNTSATWTTQVILITTRVNTYFQAPICTIRQVNEYKERNNFILRTTFWECLVPMSKCVWKVRHKNSPLQLQTSYQKVIYHIVAANAYRRPCIVAHTNTASFLIRTLIYETMKILFSKNYWKLSKFQVRSSWTVLESSCRVLQVRLKWKTLQQLVYILTVVKLWPTFDIQIDRSLATFGEKLENRSFQKFHGILSKHASIHIDRTTHSEMMVF